MTPEAFGSLGSEGLDTLRGQLVLAAQSGRLEVLAVEEGDGREAFVLLSLPAPGHRAVVGGLAGPGPEAMRAALRWIVANSELVTVGEEAGPGWLQACEGGGLTPFLHQTFENPLAASLPFLDLDPAPPALAPWADEALEPLVALVAQASAGTLPGLLLTLPATPTRAAIASHMRAQAAPTGPLLRPHSFLWREEGRLLGCIWLTDTPDGPMLYELAVAPEARGRGIGRSLVRAAQRSLVAAGQASMRFQTTDTNSPVHRIYAPEEVILRASQRGAWWLAATAAL